MFLGHGNCTQIVVRKNRQDFVGVFPRFAKMQVKFYFEKTRMKRFMQDHSKIFWFGRFKWVRLTGNKIFVYTLNNELRL